MRFRVPTIAFCVGLACLLLPASRAIADLAVGSIGTPYLIDFDNTVNDVNNGRWMGTGFQPSPAAGRLDSDSWATTGWSDGDLAFGGTRTSGANYTIGVKTAATTALGVYAFEFTPTNHALWFQPGINMVFDPGTVTLRVKNSMATAVAAWDLSYALFNINDSNYASTFNLSYSTDNLSYAAVPSLDFTSAGTAVGPSVLSMSRAAQISATVAGGGNLYLRWSSNTISGSDNSGRDEFGLDDISITALAVPEPSAFLLGWVCGAACLAGRVARRRCPANAVLPAA